MSMLSEFKKFAMRGNVIDLAVGVVIGAAFGKIVSVLVDQVIMPPIGLLIGGVDFSSLVFTIKSAGVNAAGEAVPAVVIGYGNFINALVQFTIVAFAIFMVVKAINSMQAKEPEAPSKPAQLSAEAKLLTEIRDSLRAR